MTAVPQPLRALTVAQHVRIKASEFKASVRNLPPGASARRVSWALTERHDDQVIGAIPLLRLMLCIRGLGETKVASCLIAAGCKNFERRIRDLTPRQRDAVAIQLEMWADRRRS